MSTKHEVVGQVAWKCTRQMMWSVFGLLAVYGLLRMGTALIQQASMRAVGERWTLWITHDRTTMMPITLIAWVTFGLSVWALCIASKLNQASSRDSTVTFGRFIVGFQSLAVLGLVCGVLPAVFTTVNALGNASWDTLAQRGGWDLISALTVFATGAPTTLILLNTVGLFMVFMMTLVESASHVK